MSENNPLLPGVKPGDTFLIGGTEYIRFLGYSSQDIRKFAKEYLQ